MLETPRGLRLIVLAAIVLCIVASLTGARAGQAKGELRIAIVDMQRISDEYALVKNYYEQADKQEKDFKIEVDVMQRNYLLPDADRKALIALKIKEANPATPLTKADLEKKTALEMQSKNLYDEWSKLQTSQVQQIGPNEQAKINDYSKRQKEASDYLAGREQAIKLELGTKGKEIKVIFDENRQNALTDVAKKNNYSLILDKQIAPYAEFDCTKDVLTQLNKKDKKDKG